MIVRLLALAGLATVLTAAAVPAIAALCASFVIVHPRPRAASA